MWIWLSLASAVLLGLYDVAKKHALKKNGVLWILFAATALSALFLSPTLKLGEFSQHLMLILKAFIVTLSWVTGLVAMRLLPLTTASTVKASRPLFVLIFSILIFGERLNFTQFGGVILIMLALFLLSKSSKKEGISFTHNNGMIWMIISVLSGAASALYDKYILKTVDLEPLFVQAWCDIYITLFLGILLIIKAVRVKKGEGHLKIQWDWSLLLIAVFITIADCLYFFALKQDGAMLGIISMVRRSSVIITFVLGAILFKEHNIREKAVDLAILLGGLVLLLY